jgi:TM2 domain-containing membrane protein YozV
MERRYNKSLGITILLAVLLPGAGHLYLDYIKRGIISLILTFVLSFGFSILLPFPVSLIPIGIYYIWQIYDAYKNYKKVTTIPR